MFWTFFWFEIKLRFRSISTYVFFLIPFLLAFFCVSVADVSVIPPGKVLLNGSYALLETFGQITGFGSILIAAIFGPTILRDFHRDTYSLIFTKPVTKFDYLGGKWLAAFVVTLFVFSGLVWGGMIGTFMPWADKTRLAPIHLMNYLRPFFGVSIINIFFLGALFYCVAALSRRIVVVYLQGVGILSIYLILAISVVVTNRLDRSWASVADPLGMVYMGSIMRYWTVVERNYKVLEWTGPFLYNRLMWTGVGCMALAATYFLFPMSAEMLTSRRVSKKAREAAEMEEQEKKTVVRSGRLPQVRQSFSGGTSWAQFASLTWMRAQNITREIPLWAIAFLMVVFCAIDGYLAGQSSGVKLWPVTYLMLDSLNGGGSLFLYIVAALYGGELVWEERDVRFDQIHDALPQKDWVDWLSKFFSLVLVEIALLTIVMVIGIISQTLNGFYHYQLLHYVKELYLIWLPQVLMVVLLALFVHTVVKNKFIGHAIIVGLFVVLIPVIQKQGIESSLVLYSQVTPYTYSDMNGYGHFVKALFWISAYWLSVGGLLGVLAIVLARRGAETAWKLRIKLMRERFPRAAKFALLAAGLAVATGFWFYYNTHILNEYHTSKENRARQAEYERRYKKYEMVAQPKITVVDVAVDIFPDRRSFAATGHYMLVNRTDKPITEIHVTEARESVDEVRFDRPFHNKLNDKKYFYEIYTLDQPLQPGETMRMDFRASRNTKGFMDGGERPELAYNGTFFDRDYFPTLGYSEQIELDDPVRRREEKLGELPDMAPRGDPYYSNVNLFAPDSEWVTFHCVVSTSPDQIAIAPGYLKREWSDNGRHYFEYDMGETRVANFFSFLSGRYEVKRDKWKNVNLEIYYNPGHEYNLDKMMESAKGGLDYYETNFSPFQFSQYRVLEYPRYRTFAQSFPNTVPFSEGIGFIERLKSPDDIDLLYFVNAHELAHQWWGHQLDIDLLYFVNAHELAHQWWGHQLIGSMTQGSNMMSESLAEYSALKVMEKKYGEQNIRKFLRYELDRYLRGRAGETRHEPPLALVQREPYVWYQKGALVFYALGDYIGEDKLNGALRGFLEKNRYATGPFPDTRGFVDAIRAATPPDLQYMVTDMFESIVLYENKAVSAVAVPEDGKRYKVTLAVETAKKKSDGSGNETVMDLNDVIDVGVFSGTKEHLKPLRMYKQRFSTGKSTIEVEVDERPTYAGIDPYNKLIDRNPEDNLIAVEEKK